MIGLDSCFYQGHTHTVCQDYAATIRGKGILAAAIADGCSSISELDETTGKSVNRPNPHSDIGARVLTLNALALIQQQIGRKAIDQVGPSIGPGSDPLGDLIISSSAISCKGLPGIDSKALDATLGLIVVKACTDPILKPGYQFATVILWGDGATIVRRASGVVVCRYHEYKSGAPYYLNYRLSSSRNELYTVNHSGVVEETTLRLNDPPGLAPSEEPEIKQREHFMAHAMTVTLAPGDTIMVCSDGLGSFCNAAGPVNWKQIVPDITDFKRFSGEFLKARMTFAIRKWGKDGIKHGDDFSIAAIHNYGETGEN